MACEHPGDPEARSTLQLLQRLEALLLGPDSEAANDLVIANRDGDVSSIIPSTTASVAAHINNRIGACQDTDGAQVVLQELLQVSLLNPSATLTAFDPASGHPVSHQLVMAGLTAGHAEAAQLLLLLQLTHAAQQQQQQQEHGEQREQREQATGSNSSECGGSAGKNTAVNAIVWPEFVLRRLSDMVTTTTPAKPVDEAAGSLSVIALRLLATAAASVRGARQTHLPAALPPLLSKAAAAAAAQDATTSDNTSAAGRSDVGWLSDLGPAGIAALADLATNCACAADSRSDIINDAIQLQLLLLKLIKHPTAPAQPVSAITTAAQTSIHTSNSSSNVSSPTSPMRHQLQLLLDMTHVDTVSTPLQSTCVASTAATSPPAPCCAAAVAICGNLTTMAFKVPGAATDKLLIRGAHKPLKDLIASSPKATAQQLDWSGKPSGFALKPSAATLCRCSSGQHHIPSAGAAAARMSHSDGSLLSEGCCAWSACNRVTYYSWIQTLSHADTSAPSSSSSSSSSSMQTDAVINFYPQSLLEAVLLLLLAQISTGGRATAAELYRRDVSNTLQCLSDFSTPRVLWLLEKLYGVLCLYSPQLREEVLQDGSILPLSGVIRTAMAAQSALEGPSGTTKPAAAAAPAALAAGVSPQLAHKVLLAALSCMSAAVDAVSGSEFLRFTGASGASPATANATAAVSANLHSRSPDGRHGGTTPAAAAAHVPGVLSSSSCGLAAVISIVVMKQSADGPTQVTSAASQVFLAALSRSRSMQKLSGAQMPRGGLWSQLGPRALRQLEQLAVEPGSSSSSSINTTSTTAQAKLQGVKAAAAAPASKDATVAVESSGSVSTRHSAAGSSNLSPGRRRAGAAAAAATAAGSNAKLARAAVDATSAVDADDWDEDGLRVVWSSGPSPGTAAARAAWKQYSLNDLLSWTQSSTDLYVKLLLPAGTPKKDVIVSIQPDRLTVRLSWYGRVVDGPLAKRVKPSEAHWTLDSTMVKLTPSSIAGSNDGDGAAAAAGSSVANAVSAPQEFTELEILLPKEVGGKFWRALFDGGAEKSHLEVLQEAISNDDDARCGPTVDELGPEAALLYEELRERQELMVSGQWDIENSFDDFRLVIGDNTL